MHFQIIRAVRSAIKDRVIPEIQNNMGSLSSGHQDTDSGMFGNDEENSEQTTRLKTILTKKNSKSAFDLGETGDLSPYR